MSQSPLLTRQEVARYIRCSVRSVDAWAKAGKLRKIKVGGKTFFRRDEVERMIS